MNIFNNTKRSGLVALLSFAALTATAVQAADWPQWRGTNRDGLSKETGLLKMWPATGPKLAWKTMNLGEGHATPSVAGGRIYGMGTRNAGKDEMVFALDEKTGKEIWATRIADGVVLDRRQGGNGSRATPTVDGNFLYTLGVAGELVCLNRTTGKIVWQKNLVKDFGGELPGWGYCESPLVDGPNVLITPGGATTMVLLNKTTGATVWKANVPNSTSAYASPLLITNGGKKQYIQFISSGVVGVEAATGRQLWLFTEPASRGGINCSTPIYKDGYVFAAAAYQHGGALAKLTGTGDMQKAESQYFTRDMTNHHGGMVLVGDYLYGFDDRARALTCIEFKTGKVMWADPGIGKGSVMYADGHIIHRAERGKGENAGLIALVEANPMKYVEKGRFNQTDLSGENAWPYPVIANGVLYIRDQNVLLAYDLKEKKK